MERNGHRLRRVDTPADWAAYHDIRRAELFAVYRPDVAYDADHPDEHEPSNLPHVLDVDGAVIGTVRIDLMGAERAAFRLIAIRRGLQRRGHGGVLLRLAEALVGELGCSEVTINAIRPALPFYMRNGYRPGDWHDVETPHADTIRVGKRLDAGMGASLFGALKDQWLAAGGA
jgi:GNAT superfamily N-acetyltransferase